MHDAIKRNKGIFIICGLYFIVSIVLFVVMTGGNAIISPDSSGYINPAKQLLKNLFFSYNGITPDYFRTPGYPLFLAFIYRFGGSDTTVVIAQIVLLTLKLYIFYQILILLHTPKNLSLLGAGLLLCNVQSYGYSFAILTEPLFGFFIILSLYFLVKYVYGKKELRLFVLFSITLHYALLTRPVLLYFNMLICIVLFAAFVFKKANAKYAVIFSLFFVLMIGGWSCRNYIHSGVFTFSTIQKSSMQKYFAPITSAGPEYARTHDVTGFIEGATDYHEELFLQEYPEAKSDNLNQAQISLLQGKYGEKFIKRHLPEFLMVNVVGLFKMMLTPFTTTLLYQATALSAKIIVVEIVQWLYRLYIYIVYLLYIWGLFIVFKKRDVIQISIFLLCGYLAATSAIFGHVRYRDQFFPLLVLGAAANSKYLIQRLLTTSKFLSRNYILRTLLS